MTEVTSFQVARDALSCSRFASVPHEALQPGEVLARIDRFAFTANNITYAEAGVVLRYWEFFPAPEGWGVIPVWGFADVAESRHEGIAPGERLYGYWPMATHAVLRPQRVDAHVVVDGTPHRRELPMTYNLYQRVSAGSPIYDPRHEDMHSLFMPLFGTSFLLDDFLAERGFFGAGAVLITSASGKTAFSLAHLLHRRGGVAVIGITSPRNRAFVAGLGCYDRVLLYEEIAELPVSDSAVLVDFAGDGKVRRSLHEHLRDSLKHSAAVGMSHRDLHPPGKGLPGPKPEFFFAPAQRRRRMEEWGREKYMARFAEEWNAFLPFAQHRIEIAAGGRDAIERVYLETLEGKVPPERGNILSL